jgi:hypothetical protein
MNGVRARREVWKTGHYAALPDPLRWLAFTPWPKLKPNLPDDKQTGKPRQ